MTPDTESGKSAAGNGLAKLAVLLAVALAFVILNTARPPGIAGWSNPEALARVMKDTGISGHLGFMLFASVLIFAGVPRLLFFALGGMLMGFGEGFVLSLAASMIGSYASFSFLRWGCRDWLVKQSRSGKLPRRISDSDPTVLAVFIVRQLPVSNLLINAGLAMGRVRTPSFLIGSLLGFIPQGLVAILIGSGAGEENPSHGMARLGTAAAIMAAAWLVWITWPRKQTRTEQEV